MLAFIWASGGGVDKDGMAVLRNLQHQDMRARQGARCACYMYGVAKVFFCF